MSNSKRGMILRNTSRQERISEYYTLPAVLRKKTAEPASYLTTLVGSSKSFLSYLSSTFFSLLFPKTEINNVVRHTETEEISRSSEKKQSAKNETGINTELEVKRPGDPTNDLIVKKRKFSSIDVEVQTDLPYTRNPVAKKNITQKPVRIEHFNTDIETKGTDDENDEVLKNKGKKIVKRVRRNKKSIDLGPQLSIIPDKSEKIKRKNEEFDKYKKVTSFLNEGGSLGNKGSFFQFAVESRESLSEKIDKKNETGYFSFNNTPIKETKMPVLDKVQPEIIEKTQSVVFSKDQLVTEKTQYEKIEIKQTETPEIKKDSEKTQTDDPDIIKPQNTYEKIALPNHNIHESKKDTESQSIFDKSQLFTLKKNSDTSVSINTPEKSDILTAKTQNTEEKDKEKTTEKTYQPFSSLIDVSSNPFLNKNLVKAPTIPFTFGSFGQKLSDLPQNETTFKEQTPKAQPLFNSPEIFEKNYAESNTICDIDMGSTVSSTPNLTMPNFAPTSVNSSLYNQPSPVSNFSAGCLPNNFIGGNAAGNSDKLFGNLAGTSIFSSGFGGQSGNFSSFMPPSSLLDQPKPTLFSGNPPPFIASNENKGFSLGVISSRRPKK